MWCFRVDVILPLMRMLLYFMVIAGVKSFVLRVVIDGASVNVASLSACMFSFSATVRSFGSFLLLAWPWTQLDVTVNLLFAFCLYICISSAMSPFWPERTL